MNIQSIILLLVILVAFFATLRYLVKGGSKKKCSGCSGCSLADSCNKKEKSAQNHE